MPSWKSHLPIILVYLYISIFFSESVDFFLVDFFASVWKKIFSVSTD